MTKPLCQTKGKKILIVAKISYHCQCKGPLKKNNPITIQTKAITNDETRIRTPFIKSDEEYPYWYAKNNPTAMIIPPLSKIKPSDNFLYGSSSRLKKLNKLKRTTKLLIPNSIKNTALDIAIIKTVFKILLN